jgi:hypothetical protein
MLGAFDLRVPGVTWGGIALWRVSERRGGPKVVESVEVLGARRRGNVDEAGRWRRSITSMLLLLTEADREGHHVR